MTQKGFGEDQIAFALCRAESGTPVGKVCRKLGDLTELLDQAE